MNVVGPLLRGFQTTEFWSHAILVLSGLLMVFFGHDWGLGDAAVPVGGAIAGAAVTAYNLGRAIYKAAHVRATANAAVDASWSSTLVSTTPQPVQVLPAPPASPPPASPPPVVEDIIGELGLRVVG